jgi:NADPH:quinone reductase-like Zn-dependent oxidoreductase
MSPSSQTVAATARAYRLAIPSGTLRPDMVAVPADLPPDAVLVRMRAASLNYRDLLILEQRYAHPVADGTIPLSDGAGVVERVGGGVTRFRPGDRVVPAFFQTWIDGPFDAAYGASALGGAVDGTLAELRVFSEQGLARTPDHLDDGEAATLPCAAVTVWHALFTRGGLKSGETVLVQGTGGVALYGLQLATAAGARVIVTSSSDAKLERARALGAWATINYRTHPEWDKEALRLTEGRGVDQILDLGGPDTIERSMACLAPGGKVAVIGVLTGFDIRANMIGLLVKNASVNGIMVGSRADLEAVSAFMARHGLHPVVDRRFAFDDASAALELMKAAGHFGKIVVEF